MVEIRGMGLAAGGVGLIGSQGRIAIDESDAIERNRELLRDQLLLRGGDSLAELLLAAVRCDTAVGGDGEPRIDLRARGRAGNGRDAELRVRLARSHAEAND